MTHRPASSKPLGGPPLSLDRSIVRRLYVQTVGDPEARSRLGDAIHEAIVAGHPDTPWLVDRYVEICGDWGYWEGDRR